MKTLTILATFIVLPLALATAADEPAPAPPKVDPAHVFKLFDRDSDGGISLDEYKAGMVGHLDPSRIESVFKKKDADGDGKLSLSEMMYVPPDPATPAPVAKEKAPKDKSAADAKKKKK